MDLLNHKFKKRKKTNQNLTNSYTILHRISVGFFNFEILVDLQSSIMSRFNIVFLLFLICNKDGINSSNVHRKNGFSESLRG